MSVEQDRPPEGARAAERLLADAAGAAGAARATLDAATADLFLPDHARLSDADRATAARLLAGVVGAVEDEVRRALIPLLPDRPELGGSDPVAAPYLERAGVLRDAELVATILRRAVEHRLTRALAAAAAREARPALLDALFGDADGGVAGAAMALLVAQSRRFDRFADPVLARSDLPAELQHRLVWWVAAGLRAHLGTPLAGDGARVDQALAAAAAATLAGYDEGETLEGRAAALVRRLDGAGRLDDATIARAAAEGSLAFAAAALAARAGIAHEAAWAMLADPEGSRLVVLLRAIRMERAGAAEIALALALAADPRDGGERVAARIEAFDALDPDRALEALRPWRLDPAFARAIADLAGRAAP